MSAEREIVEPAQLCAPDGSLDPRAVGWSRRPLHGCALPRGWPRRKRWDYWAVMTETHLLFLLVADADYLGIGVVSLLDLATGRRFEAAAVTPLGLGVRLPDAVGGAPILFEHLGVRIAITEEVGRTTLAASARALLGERIDVDLTVERPEGHDSLTVALPLGDGRFQLTSKHLGLPARGRAVLGGAAIDFEGGWACLDFGRGIWPRRARWRWAAAAGAAGGRRIALNLGALWTDGSGLTENGLWIDGRVHKLSESVAFTPEPPGERVRSVGSDRVDLAFSPVQRRDLAIPLGVAGARLRWAAGRFSGTVAGDGGERVAVDGLLGWSEDLDARW